VQASGREPEQGIQGANADDCDGTEAHCLPRNQGLDPRLQKLEVLLGRQFGKHVALHG
jgi:hypothetical protein